MVYVRSSLKNSGTSSGIITDKLINYALYSHPNAFDSIPLPLNYADYDVLYLAVIQADVDTDAFDEDMPLIRGCSIVQTSSISASDIGISIPIYNSSFGQIASSSTYINSSRILGNNYPLAWQTLYLVGYGIKFQGTSDIPECGYVLFNNGHFYNSAIMQILPTSYVIEDGMIKLTQQSINGFVVSTSSLADPYIMIFTFETTANTSYTQCGRSQVGASLNGIVQSGTGRYSYNNSSTNANEERTIAQRVYTGGEGVFLSVGGVEAYIKEIAIFPSDGEVTAYTN